MGGMRKKIAIIIGLGCLASAPLGAQGTNSKALDLVDLMGMAGVEFPKGADLERMIREAEAHPLGSRMNPVRTEPTAQHAYLKRLRCSNGSRPAFKRVFAAGLGPFGRTMDEYVLSCDGKTEKVYVDMYHRGYVESRPIPGYTIRKPN